MELVFNKNDTMIAIPAATKKVGQEQVEEI